MVWMIYVHYSVVIINTKAFQITEVWFVTQPFVRVKVKLNLKLRVTGLWYVDSPHKRPVTRKMFPFDDVIMILIWFYITGMYMIKYRFAQYGQ